MFCVICLGRVNNVRSKLAVVTRFFGSSMVSVNVFPYGVARPDDLRDCRLPGPLGLIRRRRILADSARRNVNAIVLPGNAIVRIAVWPRKWSSLNRFQIRSTTVHCCFDRTFAWHGTRWFPGRVALVFDYGMTVHPTLPLERTPSLETKRNVRPG